MFFSPKMKLRSERKQEKQLEDREWNKEGKHLKRHLLGESDRLLGESNRRIEKIMTRDPRELSQYGECERDSTSHHLTRRVEPLI